MLAVAAAVPFLAVAADPVLDIHSAADVEAKRAALVQYIWGTAWPNVLAGQPTEVHSPYTRTDGDALPPVPNAKLIEQLVITMSVPAMGGGSALIHTSMAYLYHPQSPNGSVVVVQQGHGCAFDDSDHPYQLGNAIQDLVSAGFAAVAIRMPLYQQAAGCGHDAVSSSHADMFSDAQRLAKGSPLQFFLDPVARALNYIQTKYPSTYHDFNMMGLSGGGWTTTVYAAVDPRITLSFPVAGSLPLDLPIGRGGRDAEQTWPAFYDLAGYRDLYVMGGFGPHRRQTQILNHKDSCCFVPPDQDAADYACQVQSRISSLGSGSFALDYDDTSTSHQVSLAAIKAVILPTLKAGATGPVPGSCSAPFTWPSGALVQVVNQHSGKCMGAAAASGSDPVRVEQSECNGGKNQTWVLEGNGEMVTLSSGKCVEVPASSFDDGVVLQQQTCTGAANQLWRATPRGEIINRNSGKCVDLSSGNTSGQDALEQRSCNNGASQQWIFP